MITKLTLLPVLSFIAIEGTLIVFYILYLTKSPEKWFLPDINEIAALPLGSSIFSQMMNIGAVLMASTIYIRYRHVIEVVNRNRFFGLERLNIVSLIFGLTSTLGASIVANFQISKVLVVHEIGRILYFTCGLVYFATQTALSYYLQALIGSRILAHFRYILVSVALLLLVVMLGRDIYTWISYGGYRLQVAAAISEWLITLLFSVFILSFAIEFSKICDPKLTLLRAERTYSDLHSSSSDEECLTVTGTVSDFHPCVSAEFNSHIRSFNRVDYYNK